MKTFVAIDFETATALRSSICQIGITKVEDGRIAESKSWLIQPPDNDYDPMNIHIHGIKPEDTANSPLFPDVWAEVLPYLNGNIVVAHNTSFDMYALRDALDSCSLEYPTFDYYCSLRLARKIVHGCPSYTLPVVLSHLGINFDGHHNALNDSEGCASLMLRLLDMAGCDIDELDDKYSFHHGCFAPGQFRPQLAKEKSVSTNMSEYLSTLTVDKSKFDEGNYFYGKAVCFTGTCSYGTRKDLLAKIAEIGGIPTNAVTAKTEVLVVGEQDYRVVGDEGMSGKQKQAMKLIEKGRDIEILSESEFLSMI